MLLGSGRRQEEALWFVCNEHATNVKRLPDTDKDVGTLPLKKFAVGVFILYKLLFRYILCTIHAEYVLVMKKRHPPACRTPLVTT